MFQAEERPTEAQSQPRRGEGVMCRSEQRVVSAVMGRGACAGGGERGLCRWLHWSSQSELHKVLKLLLSL